MKINTGQYERDLIAVTVTTPDIDDAKRVVDGVTPEMFSGSHTKRAWQAISELHSEQLLFDLMGVSERMGEQGDMLWLAEITSSSCAQRSQLLHLAKRVRQSSYLIEARNRIISSLEVIDELTDVSKVNTIAGSIGEIFEGLLLETSDKRPQKFYDVAKDYLMKLNDKVNGKQDDHIIKSECADLDAHTGGFNKTDLIVMGGLSGSGKTEFAVKVARGVAKAGGGVLVFTMEMSNQQVAERAISGEAQLPVSSLRNPSRLESNDGWKRVEAGYRSLMDTNIYMTDQSGLTVNQIITTAKRHKRDNPDLALIEVDHVGLMELGQSSSGRHDLQVGEISRKLKQLAKEIETPVVLLTQLTGKQVMARPVMEREPRAQDIKDSSRIEEDADLILLCHRQWTHDETAPNIAEIVLAKARHAIKGTKVYYRFIDGHFISTAQDIACNEMDQYKTRNIPVAYKKSDKLK